MRERELREMQTVSLKTERERERERVNVSEKSEPLSSSSTTTDFPRGPTFANNHCLWDGDGWRETESREKSSESANRGHSNRENNRP